MPWSTPFREPIAAPGGRALRTLRDAAGRETYVNLDNIVAMDRAGPATTLYYAAAGNSVDRSFGMSFLVKETPDQILMSPTCRCM
jgi:hypothetical protein